LSPDPSRGPQVEVDVGEPRRRAVAIADERHAVAVLDPLHGWRHRDAGIVQPLEGRPFVRLPPRLEVLLAEARPLLYGSALMPTALAPDTCIEVVVPEGALQPRLEALLGHETRARRTGPGDEINLALLAGLEHAEVAIFVRCVGKPVAREQRGHASSVLETRRWVRPSRVPLQGARRSGDAEAGGVTRDSNAHSTASLSLSTRWSREKSSTHGIALGLGGRDGNAGTTRS